MMGSFPSDPAAARLQPRAEHREPGTPALPSLPGFSQHLSRNKSQEGRKPQPSFLPVPVWFVGLVLPLCCLTLSSPINTSSSIPVITVTHFKMWACQLKVSNLRVRRIREEFASLSADILMSRRGKLISLGAHAFSSVLFSKSFADSHLPVILFSSFSVHLVFTAGLVWPGQ